MAVEGAVGGAGVTGETPRLVKGHASGGDMQQRRLVRVVVGLMRLSKLWA